MFRDGQVRLTDAFTVGDLTGIANGVRVDCSLLSIFLFFFSFFLVLCVLFI